jgi:hypothetical protein
VIPGSAPSFAMAPGVRSGTATKVGNFMSNITTFDQINILADRLEARGRDMELSSSMDAQFAADLVLVAEILRSIAPLMQMVDEMQGRRQIQQLMGADDRAS